MKKLVSILIIMCMILVGVVFANPFTVVKEKHESSTTSGPFGTVEEIEEVKTSTPFKTTLESKDEIKSLENSVNSIGDTIGRTLIIFLVIGVAIAVIISALIALIVCAIKAKKAGGFSNAVKESFWKVFLITLAIVITVFILF